MRAPLASAEHPARQRRAGSQVALRQRLVQACQLPADGLEGRRRQRLAAVGLALPGPRRALLFMESIRVMLVILVVVLTSVPVVVLTAVVTERLIYA